MKKFFVTFAVSVVILAILLALAQFYGCFKVPYPSQIVLFKNPTNDAQKVANFVFAKGKAQRFNVGLKDEGTTYNYKLYIDYDMYDLEVFITHNNGKKNLHINHYRTNLSLQEMQTPADLVAHELIYGPSKIIVEEHIHDYGVNMDAKLFQTFKKKRGSVFEGFTREERDSKTSGVQEYVYDDGQELENGKWKAASKKKTDEITEYYQEVLVEVLKALEKK